MRVLCLDIGTKRIGMAVSDPMGWTAQPEGVMERDHPGMEVCRIGQLCRRLDVKEVVVGMPYDEEGGIGPQAKYVRQFIGYLRDHFKSQKLDIPIIEWDERYSTAIAEERLIEADVSREKRKRVIDKMAAAVILQDYLESEEYKSKIKDQKSK